MEIGAYQASAVVALMHGHASLQIRNLNCNHEGDRRLLVIDGMTLDNIPIACPQKFGD